MRTIPGKALEIRYLRSTDGERYKHTFTTPVTMRANRDGSVTLKGPKRIWDDDGTPDFEKKYLSNHGARRARRNPYRGNSSASFNVGHFLVFMLAATVVGRLIDSRLGSSNA